MLEVESKVGMGIEEFLRVRFVDENKTLYEISEESGVAYRTVLKWLYLSGVYSRNLKVGEPK